MPTIPSKDGALTPNKALHVLDIGLSPRGKHTAIDDASVAGESCNGSVLRGSSVSLVARSRPLAPPSPAHPSPSIAGHPVPFVLGALNLSTKLASVPVVRVLLEAALFGRHCCESQLNNWPPLDVSFAMPTKRGCGCRAAFGAGLTEACLSVDSAKDVGADEEGLLVTGSDGSFAGSNSSSRKPITFPECC